METKTVKNFIYTGLGFPVGIDQVEMIKLEDEWHPKIDVKRVADLTVKMLATHKERLTGNQVKFIRTYFSMSLREFSSQVVHESHTAISKWEKLGDKVTNMDINIEMMLRLYIIERLEAKTVKQRNNFYEKYLELKKIYAAGKTTGKINLKQTLLAS